MASLISDAELLALGLAATALTAIGADVRAQHCDTATGEVLTRLGVRFEIPEDWTPGADTKGAIAAIAAASLLGRRGYDPRAGAPADPIATRAQRADRWLDAVVDGKARPLNVESLTERRGALVAGTQTSAWSGWRSGGYS